MKSLSAQFIFLVSSVKPPICFGESMRIEHLPASEGEMVSKYKMYVVCLSYGFTVQFILKYELHFCIFTPI